MIWKSVSNKIKYVTCPTLDLKKNLEKMNIFDSKKIYFLQTQSPELKNLKRKSILF